MFLCPSGPETLLGSRESVILPVSILRPVVQTGVQVVRTKTGVDSLLSPAQ